MTALTAGDLRRELADLPDDMPIALARSAESTECAPVSVAAESLYAPGSEYSGEFYPTPEMDALVPFGQGPAPDHAVRALILWPAS